MRKNYKNYKKYKKNKEKNIKIYEKRKNEIKYRKKLYILKNTFPLMFIFLHKVRFMCIIFLFFEKLYQNISMTCL